MKTLTPKEGVQILAVDEVPQDAINITLISGDERNPKAGISFELENGETPEVKIMKLPDGVYKELGWSDEITEELARELVKRSGFSLNKMRYWNYLAGEFTYLDDALPSFQSFLSANGITNRTYLLKLIK